MKGTKYDYFQFNSILVSHIVHTAHIASWPDRIQTDKIASFSLSLSASHPP